MGDGKETVEQNEESESQEYSSSEDNTPTTHAPGNENNKEESEEESDSDSDSDSDSESKSDGEMEESSPMHHDHQQIMLVNGEKVDRSSELESHGDTNAEGIAKTQTTEIPESSMIGLSHKKPKSSVSPKKQIVAKSITPTKRLALDTDNTQNEIRDSKKAIRKLNRSKDVVSGANEEKIPFKRKWSTDDEIIILEGIIKLMKDEVVGRKGTVPVEGLFQSIKNSLDFKPTIQQLKEKTKRLKQKYERNAGKPPQIMQSQEAKLFELSRKAWGALEIARRNNNVQQLHVCSQFDGLLRVDCLSRAKEVLTKGFDLLQGLKKSDLDEQMTELLLEEIELYMKKLDIMKDHLHKAKNDLQASLRATKKTD